MKRIEWRTKALRQLRKIKNRQTKNTVYDAISMLVHFPDCKNIKKLANRDDYRLRVGDWRVIFTSSLTILYIEEIKKRNERTY